MNKLDIAKRVASTIVGLGTTKIVNDVIRNNTDTETTADKVKVTAGALVIGSMAADATSSYTDQKIDEIAAWWTKNITNRNSTEN